MRFKTMEIQELANRRREC